jgi:hypothetical protein
VDTALPWPSDATLLFDATELGFSCTGEARHHYDAVQAAQQRGDAALAPVFTWDGEVWVAVEIGDIGAGTSLQQVSLRDVMEHVRAANPPRFWPTSTRRRRLH